MIRACAECGFPMDTPERAHAFIHQQFEALIEHRKALRESTDYAVSTREALRELLAAVDAAFPAAEAGMAAQNAWAERRERASKAAKSILEIVHPRETDADRAMLAAGEIPAHLAAPERSHAVVPKQPWDDGTARAEVIRVLDRYFHDSPSASLVLGFAANDILKALRCHSQGLPHAEQRYRDGLDEAMGAVLLMQDGDSTSTWKAAINKAADGIRRLMHAHGERFPAQGQRNG